MKGDAAKIISEASAGRALRGFWPLLDVDDHTEPLRLGKQKLLRLSAAAASPDEDGSCDLLMNSDQKSSSVAYCFAGSAEATSFSQCVKDKGWTIASRLHAKLCLWGVSAAADASFDRNNAQKEVSERKLSMEVSEVCITHCIYMPLRCFQIPKHKMVLSDAALQQALAIQDGSDAYDFLCTFGPFVSQSLYQLGGFFFSEVTVEISEESSLLALMSQTQREMKGALKGNVHDHKILATVQTGAEASGQSKVSKDSSSNDSAAINREKRVEVISILGSGNAMDVDAFRQKLGEDPHCMAIIDKGADGRDSLVGVWELLAEHSTSDRQAAAHDQHQLSASSPSAGDLDHNIAAKLRNAAKLLCQRWLEYMDEISRASCDINHKSSRDQAAAEFYSALINQSQLFLANLPSVQSKLISSSPQHQLPTPPLPEYSPKDLVQELDQLVLAAEGPHSQGASASNISQAVSDLLRSLISQSSQNTEHLTKEHLRVLTTYGFYPRKGEWMSQLDLTQLKSMIQEIKEIPNIARGQSREHIPTSAWGDDLFDHMSSTHASTVASSSSCHEFRYFGDMLVDRSLSVPSILPASMSLEGAASEAQVQHNFRHAAACRLIDCLRHRLNPLDHLLQATDCDSSSLSSNPTDNFGWGSDNGNCQANNMDLSPFELLMQIIRGSDLSIQIAVCDLLLSQRSAIPLIFPHVQPQQVAAVGAEHAGEVSLVHYTKALSFVKANLDNEQKLCIAHDISLPRVVFISDRSVQFSHAAIVASRILNCNFMSQYHRDMMNELTDEITVVEVGVGFIPFPKTATAKSSGQNKSNYFACVSIQITGNYDRVISFVGEIADVIVLELKEGNRDAQQLREPPTPSSYTLLRWQETGTQPGCNTHNKVIWGQETYIVQRIEKFLQAHLKVNQLQDGTRESITEVCSRHFLPGHADLYSLEESLKSMFLPCDFTDIRKQMTLQRSLIVEADAYFGRLQQLHDPAKKHEKEKACKKEREKRLRMAKDVLINVPLMKPFYHVLNQAAALPRRLGIMLLERELSEKMFAVLEDASRRVDTHFQAFNKNRNDEQARSKYYQAKQDYVDKSVGLENLWREMCHIYEADPHNQRQLTRLAAQHLLDGFPLEILDGDAGMYCKLWVESVLVEVDSMAKAALGRSARTFVLSVMGLQSSGKSTMLNLMFGTQLRTSTGRCTRGVYMQIVPSERPEYDYVLLLDTEGLRSPELSGLQGSAVRDNRLATFGLLPSDASMFMVCNEDDGGLKEVLPMVLLAFKGSAIAEKFGQRIKAKVVFIYRSVDTNDQKKLKGSMQKLHEHLIEAAAEVARMGSSLSSSGANFITAEAGAGEGSSQCLESPNKDVLGDQGSLLTDFRVNDCDEDSDVKFLGNLKKGGKPPADTPEWAYGESVVELREYLHSRVVSDINGTAWKASTFQECAERLGLVWECICSADFELSFISRMQYASYLELQASLQPPRALVSSKYLEAFTASERTLLSEEAATSVEGDSRTNLRRSALEGDVRVVVDSQTDEVEKILDSRKSYAQWKPQELENWKRFCDSTEDWYKKRIDDLISGVLEFDKVVAAYQRRCKSELVDQIERGQWGPSGQITDEERKEKFENMFRRILQDAQTNHPPVANELSKKVMARYMEVGVAVVVDLQDGHGEPHPMESKRSPASNRFFTAGKDFVKKKWGWITGVGAEGGVDQPRYYPTLQLMIDRQLRDANQYSDVIVFNCINATRAILKGLDPNLTKEEEGKAHIWVKDTLTNRLKDIQSEWDKNHNVAEKLKSKEVRGELENFFEDLCKGLEATVLLVNQLQRCFEKELKEAHRAAVVEYVANQLKTEGWLRDWRMMRAILDYHLLTLMRSTKNTDELIKYATQGPLHFADMMVQLVGQAIRREIVEREWERLIQKVQNCLNEEAWMKNPSVEAFLLALRRRLADCVSAKLANAVANSIHVKSEDKSRNLDGEFYEKKLPELCQSLERMAKPDFQALDTRAILTQAVVKEMCSVPDENCRPRCTAACPICGSTCYLAQGHNAAKHDTIHQPAGLSGCFWHDTKDLFEKSCLQHIETPGSRFRWRDGINGNVRIFLFSDFEKEFPTWAKPSNNEATSVQARECIFFHFQDQLVKFWNDAQQSVRYRPARNMPAAYNHDRAQLQAQLVNTLRPKFHDDESWTQFNELLAAS